ncbi:MAG: ParB-like nuclease domain-containing protein [Deltaproteobacteria bacterium]|nr:ParB-like nuclease domain-containing protein [Candidatus Zymogenaceae bacterium]
MSDCSKYNGVVGNLEVFSVSPDLIDQEGLFGAPWERLRGDEADDLLVSSIRQCGVREPIKLITAAGVDDRYHLVTGRGRLLAARDLGLEAVPAMLLDTGREDAVIRGLMEHYPDRRYSAAQCAVLMDRLVNDIGVERFRLLSGDVPALLGFSAQERVLDDLLAAAGLGVDILGLAHGRGYSLRILMRWARFDTADRRDIAELLRRVRLGSGPADEVLGVLWEMKVRDETTVKDILDSHELVPLLDGDEGEVIRRGEELRSLLRGLRYPRFTAQKMEFDRAAASLPLPKSASIDHHPTFEGDGIGFSCRFYDPDDIEEAARFLTEAAGSDAVRKLFSLV